MKSFKVVVILLGLLLSFSPMQVMAADSGADATILSNAGNPKPKSDNINKPITASKSILKKHERLVLMPLRLTEDDKQLQGAMEAALVEGLQQQYEVFAGEIVSQKAREIFLKESRDNTKKYCDETRCMQNIAEAFQTEYIATVSVTKQKDGYFLALIIQNIFDNLVVYSNSVPCENCDTFTVVNKLKELAHQSVAEKAVVEDESILSNSWGSVALKPWFATMNAHDGGSNRDYTEMLAAVTFGYEGAFFNASFSGDSGKDSNGKPTGYSGGSPIPVTNSNGTTSLVTSTTFLKFASANIGYFITPEWAVTFGNKSIEERYSTLVLGTVTDSNSLTLISYGLLYTHKIQDTPFSVNGTIAFGKHTYQAGSNYNYVGTLSGTSAFEAFDIGASYVVYSSLKLLAYYRFEQWGTLFPTAIDQTTSPYTVSLTQKTITLAGPGVGISYSF